VTADPSGRACGGMGQRCHPHRRRPGGEDGPAGPGALTVVVPAEPPMFTPSAAAALLRLIHNLRRARAEAGRVPSVGPAVGEDPSFEGRAA